MLVPYRHKAVDEGYRYGFQGQEKDDETKGEGNSINYKYRMHDPRVGRFFAIDPLTKKYPNYTPYSFSGNKVIAHVELEGLEDAWFMEKRIWDGSVIQEVLYKDDPQYELTRQTYAQLSGIKVEDLPTSGALSTIVKMAPSADGSYSVGKRLVGTAYVPTLEINADNRSWGEMADDWVNSIKGNSAHEGEDWIKGGGFKVQGEVGVNAYSIAFDFGTYSSHENSAGAYWKVTRNEKEFDLSAGMSNGWGAVGSALLSIMPKADFGVYLYGNTKTSLDLNPNSSNSNSVIGNLGSVRIGADNEGNILFGVGGGTQMFNTALTPYLNPKNGANVNNTTSTPLLIGNTEEINLGH